MVCHLQVSVYISRLVLFVYLMADMLHLEHSWHQHLMDRWHLVHCRAADVEIRVKLDVFQCLQLKDDEKIIS